MSDEVPTPRAALVQAITLFTAGNFAGARSVLRAIPRGELDEPLRKEAAELERRLGPDPLAIWIAVGCVILFAVVVITTFR